MLNKYPPRRKVSLSAPDVQALRDILKFSETEDRNAPGYVARLCERERAMPDAARIAFYYWPSDRVTAALRRWMPGFSVTRTASGYSVRRWIKARRCYAKRPLRQPRGGWTQADIACFQSLIHV